MQRTDNSHELTRADYAIRMALWATLIVLGIRELSANGNAPVGDYFIAFICYGIILLGYVVLTVQPTAQAVRQFVQHQPLLLALAPLIFLVPFGVYAREQPDFEPSGLLASGMMLFLPIACALLNTPKFRRTDLAIGLITVALPLAAPLFRNEALARQDIALRAGALFLPIALVLLTNREQKQKLHFLFVCAVLSLWFATAFNAFPEYILPNTANTNYFSLLVLPVFGLVLMSAGQFERVGWSFVPSLRGLANVLLHLGLATLILVPLGLFVNAWQWNLQTPTWQDALSEFFTLYLFVALPKELLFRGTLLTYLKDTLGIQTWVAVLISSVIFGVSHLNNGGTPNTILYVAFATLAGVIYASTYLRRKNIAASATVHTFVNWLWNLFFYVSA